MSDAIDRLRGAGFSDAEIGNWVQNQRTQLAAAGFSEEDIAAHFGALHPSKDLPKPYLDRLIDGPLGRIASRMAEYAAIGFGDDPVGISPENIQFLRDHNFFRNDYNEDLLTPFRRFNELGIPLAIMLHGSLRGINAGIKAAGAGLGQTGEEIFGTMDRAPGLAAREFAQLADIAATLIPAHLPAVPLRPRIGPRGAAYHEPLATPPLATDFRNAADLLAGDLSPAEKQARLGRLYEEHGIHPAEVAEAARHDPAILQRLLFNEGADRASAAPHPAESAGQIGEAARHDSGNLPSGLSNASDADRGVPRPADPPGQDLGAGLRHGLVPQLRVEADVDEAALQAAPPLRATVKSAEDARAQIGRLDDILARHPDADVSDMQFARMAADALGTRDVPVPPSGLLEAINSEQAVTDLRRLTAPQLAAARDGLATTREIRDAYRAGDMQVDHTGKLFLWSFLSRKASPFAHEGLFIDAFRGIGKWIKKAAAGEFSDADLAAFESWADGVAPPGSGQPGGAVRSNLVDFGRQFLTKMAERTEDGGMTKLQQVHDMLADADMTGKQIRRWFVENARGSGAGNKVVSLALLSAGYDDVMVLDRIMINKYFKNKRFGDSNLYGCCTIDGDLVANSGLERIMSGPLGLFYYESMERAIASRVKDIYAAAGRADDASVARWHWENWISTAQRDVAHETLKLIRRTGEDVPGITDGVTAREGRFQSYQYGTQYGRDAADRPFKIYSSPSGAQYRFSLDQYDDFMDKVRDYREGVVPRDFKVSEATNEPWYQRDGVDRQRLDDLAEKHGTRIRIR